MHIIINGSSMTPIYEQIVEQISALIRDNSLREGESLPSVRGLAKDLKISALTVKKAYDLLEEQGLVKTIHGKGTFVNLISSELLLEEQLKALEKDIEALIFKAKNYGISKDKLKDLFVLYLEEL